jgi:hypothetical protein
MESIGKYNVTSRIVIKEAFRGMTTTNTIFLG